MNIKPAEGAGEKGLQKLFWAHEADRGMKSALGKLWLGFQDNKVSSTCTKSQLLTGTRWVLSTGWQHVTMFHVSDVWVLQTHKSFFVMKKQSITVHICSQEGLSISPWLLDSDGYHPSWVFIPLASFIPQHLETHAEFVGGFIAPWWPQSWFWR